MRFRRVQGGERDDFYIILSCGGNCSTQFLVPRIQVR